ncbi:MAG: LysR family transcriptional regulator [Clostridia bacterium]|nr:LysR family transcriptional regulator [Clostridia bacterium]
MEIEWLRQIVELSKSGSFGHTAAKCFISQPALSKHVASVEYALGTQIFLREGHRVRMTCEGAQFVRDMEAVIQGYDAAIARLNASLEQRQRRLRIGYLDNILPERFMEISLSMRRLYPGCVLEFLPFDAVSVMHALREDRIELALLMLLEDRPAESGLLFMPVQVRRLVAVLPKAHPLAGKEGLRWADLTQERIITPSPDAAIAAPLFKILSSHGLRGRDDLHFSTFYDACLMIGMGAGAALLPAYVREYEAQLGIRCLPLLEEDAPADRLGCLWKRGNSNPLVKIFVDQFAALLDRENNEKE